MIILGDEYAPRAAVPKLLDFGMVLRPSTGAPALRVDRGGTRYAIEISFPPMTPDKARALVSKLQRAKSEGLQMRYPLMGQDQGGLGALQIDGTDSAGTTIKIKGGTASGMIREGFWLNVTDAAGGRYLHSVAAPVRIASDGRATLSIWPPVRCVLANNAEVLIARPLIEGLVTSEATWQLPRNRLVDGIGFTLEEAA